MRNGSSATGGEAVKSFRERVWRACKRIPKGRVSTYGEIARFLGCKGASRPALP
ncbi:hypothetical protein COX86_03695 [Candidatus Micrarchaeota archaeon CG_4_10_14_0_2_um_filter_60_11]|nr:MAG: hypothetical protein COX86_03695 [Candidatus Micrarchaeota archaeon CG_4_10_14_0_2_um_filter_60_11]